jgi:stalled ribosome rescue protein Dom34
MPNQCGSNFGVLVPYAKTIERRTINGGARADSPDRMNPKESPMSQAHAIVWLDHREARIAYFSLGKSGSLEVHSRSPHLNIHRKAGSFDSGHVPDDHQFFDEIADSLVGTNELLIAGPGNAKTAFETYINKKHVALAKRVVGIETLDHPTDAELLAHARKAFTAIDQLGVTEG